MEVIKFAAQVAKVQSLADGGIRLTLDLPEDAIMQAAQLMECKRWGAALNVTATPTELGDALINKGNTHAEKGTNKQSKWTPAQE